jgi:long-chain acyl-CoA synthetase
MKAAKVDTLDKLFSFAFKKNGTKKCLGVREVLGEEDETQPNGKVFKKFNLGGYMWKNYIEVDNLVGTISRGFREIGLQPKDKICLFAETRPEWLISAIAAFRQNLAIVTLYSTLGDEGVIHGVKQTEVELIVTSHDLLPKFRTLLAECPHVKYIIYMEDPLHKTDRSGFPPNISIFSFCEVLEMGSKSNYGVSPPTPEDTAVIMFTSGSTGIPKGVEMMHKNITSGIMGFSDAVSPVYSWDVYIAYLPLAHILELMGEGFFLTAGIPIGYSSSLTMTDTSGKIKRGDKGDASILQPTAMTVVPLILDRIYKGVQQKVKEGGPTKSAVFKFFYDYKLKWYYRGFDCPIVNSLIFKQIQAMVGGRMRFMPAGGAALSPDTQEFCRNVLNAAIMQGYGLTETNACATVTLFGDMTVGRCGQPIGCVDVRLIDWEEGNYRVTDKPFPRGEILIGGDAVAQGYYKLPEQTAQDFFDEGGKRWFRSGDIGLMEDDFVLKIIDRKKDLVKLQFGEYISLGKVESELKTFPMIDNICIYGESSKTYCIAFIAPSQVQLEALGVKLGKSGVSWEKLCDDPDVVKHVLKELQEYARKIKLQKFEIPGALKLCSELWTPESGLVTAAFKLKRKPLQDFYQADIIKLYAAAAS